MIVIACPGQGSQTPGFLSEWLKDASSAAWLREVSEQIGIDLVQHGTESDAETIRATNIAQPLIVAAGVLTINKLNSELDRLDPTLAQKIKEQLVFAGHSVGEITAAYGAGIFDAETAVRFVSLRANEMQKCAAVAETGMAAVLGGEENTVLEKLTEHGLAPANYNGGGQIVAAGLVTGVKALTADPPEKARVIPLQVAGAFHTEVMSGARETLSANRNQFAANDPVYPILTNKDGSAVTSGKEYLDLLVHQVAAPVRWDLCMKTLAEQGAKLFVECAPSGALAGLARRGLNGVQTEKINSPDDVTAFVAELASTAAA
ncbi:ACP S-malonyltransferase [Canibacter zhoujuaniae]|uniref:ACP S-malonyltransferase n=1 Tax=Canibacter zhoujuaniae TaxID=2708343 RepID=UPI001421D0E3|nr:ACP S-malonyltransferase [Canibacter zhoujuaniae]